MWAGEGREEVSGWIEGYLGKLLPEEANPVEGDDEEEDSQPAKTAAAVEAGKRGQQEGSNSTRVKEEVVDGEAVEPVDLNATVNVREGQEAEQIRKGVEATRI